MIIYTDNIIDRYDDLVEYLSCHDKDFPIPISKKVNIDEYVKKIIERGKGLLSLCNGKIIGVIFYYDNNELEKKAFISLVSVDIKFREQGIARNMLKKVIEMIDDKIEYCQIPTHISNYKAINLYKSFGFELIGLPDEKGNILLLKKLL